MGRNASTQITLNGSLGSNAVIQTSGTFTFTIGTTGNDVSVGGYSGFSAIGGTLNLNINGGAALVAFGNNFGTGGGAPLVFGSTTSNAQIILPNAISLNTTDTFSQGFYVEKGAGGDSTLLSGVLSNGTGTGAASGLVKLGGGTLILTNGASSYSGFTSVVGGTLVAENNSPTAGAATVGVFGSGYGPSTGTMATDATIALGNTQGGGATGAVINPTLMIGGNYTITNLIAVNWTNGTGQVYGLGGYLDANSTFSGLITLTGTAATGNTFSITQVANTGTNALNITGGITSTAGGNVNFANVGAVNVSTTGITNGGEILTVTQSGPGVTVLSGPNTYSGLTTVTSGTLQLGNGLSTGGLSSMAATGGLKITGGSLLFDNATFAAVGSTSVATSMGGGTLGFSSGTAASSSVSLGALTLTAGTTSVLSFSAVNQVLTFNSLAIANTSNTILDVYNYVSGDSLYFTTTTTPSVAVLADIDFYSDAGSTNLGTGMEVSFGQVIPAGVGAAPEPSTYLAGISLLALLALNQRSKRFLHDSA